MDKNKPLSEEQLGQVAGGKGEREVVAPGGYCYFTPTGAERTEGIRVWKQCSAICHGLKSCRCHGKSWCVDKWHIADGATGRLMPYDVANHEDKNPSNNYNT